MVKATNLLIKKEHDLFCLVAGGQALCAACAARARGAARARTRASSAASCCRRQQRR